MALLVVLELARRTRIQQGSSILRLKRYWKLVCTGTRYILAQKQVLGTSKLDPHWNKLDMASIDKLGGTVS